MSKFTNDISRLYLEEVSKNLILDRYTSFEEVLKANTITVYHSCSFHGDFFARISSRKEKNIHAGSLFQAVWRADYKVNDEQVYPVSYIYELVIKPESIYNKLIHDSGENVDQSEEDQYKNDYDLLVYHNTGEGHRHEPNLSVIVLDHSIIKSVKLHSSMNSEQITKYMEENN
jgi:hypothetical protein